MLDAHKAGRVALTYYTGLIQTMVAQRSHMAGTSLKGPGAFTGPQAPQSAFNSNDVSSVDEKTGSTHALAAGETPVTLAQLHEVVKSHKEWVKLIIFDGDGNILLSNIKPLEGDVAGLLNLYNKREDTMASGIVLLNEQYDVHRFHPPLVYGRRGDPSVEEGEGIAVCKVVQGCRTLFCLITYVYPTLSARAVPQLKEFCETQLVRLG
uniref:Profilin n=1 Tax=Hyaloperonospora arabidopsidis (strain Emoy2) TaxID=559515 RepID=M4BLE3_HYAAE